MPNIPFLARRVTRWVLSCLLLQNVPLLFRLPGFTLRLRTCPVCDGPAHLEARNACTPLDRCAVCGHVFSRKAPKPYTLRQMYRDNSFWVGDKSHQGITHVAPGPEWDGYLDARIGILKRSGVLGEESQHILEIGCSEGMLLYELGRLGHVVEGCEINPETASIGAKSLGVRIRVGPFEAFPEVESLYDGVASFHTMEHVVDLHAAFRKIHRMLKPDGGLVVEVPTGAEEYHNIFHVHFFEPESLERLLSHYFQKVTIEENRFTDPWGATIRSLYGVGRLPKR